MVIHREVRIMKYAEDYSAAVGSELVGMDIDVVLGSVSIEDNNQCRATYTASIVGTVSSIEKSFVFQWDGVTGVREQAAAEMESRV